jgi:hypothetical protein
MNTPFFSYEPTAADLVELTAVQCLREAQELSRYLRNGILAEEVASRLRTIIESRDELNTIIARIEAERQEVAA